MTLFSLLVCISRRLCAEQNRYLSAVTATFKVDGKGAGQSMKFRVIAFRQTRRRVQGSYDREIVHGLVYVIESGPIVGDLGANPDTHSMDLDWCGEGDWQVPPKGGFACLLGDGQAEARPLLAFNPHGFLMQIEELDLCLDSWEYDSHRSQAR